MKIKGIYYFSLCSLLLNRRQYYCVPNQTRYSYYLPNSIAHEVKRAHDNDRYYRDVTYHDKCYTEEEILNLRTSPEHYKRYLDIIEEDDVHVFIVTNYQLNAFKQDMVNMGLEKYLHHVAQPAINRNYPANGANLNTFIYYYKDFKRE